MIWNNIDMRGKRAAFRDTGKGRLYVCERVGLAEAWVNGVKIGNFADLDAAKAAASRRVGEHPPAPPKPQAAAPKPWPKPEVVLAATLEAVAKPIKATPLKVEPPAPSNGGLSQSYQFTNPAPHSEMVVVPPRAASPARQLHGAFCQCGARLGRSGKCPALCEPVPEVPPAYDGPRFVGRTHISRLGAPVL